MPRVLDLNMSNHPFAEEGIGLEGKITKRELAFALQLWNLLPLLSFLCAS